MERVLPTSFLFLLSLFRLGKVAIPLWKTPRPPWSCINWLKLSGSSTWPRILLKTSGYGDPGGSRQQGRVSGGTGQQSGLGTSSSILWKPELGDRGFPVPKLSNESSPQACACVWFSVPWNKEAMESEPTCTVHLSSGAI